MTTTPKLPRTAKVNITATINDELVSITYHWLDNTYGSYNEYVRARLISSGSSQYYGSFGEYDRETRKKGRVYVDGFGRLMTLPEPAQDDDAAWRKYNRAEVKTMRAAVDAVLTANGFDDAVKVSFSRNAGCSSCPCSPGFVLSGAGVGKALYITINKG